MLGIKKQIQFNFVLIFIHGWVMIGLGSEQIQ